MSKSVTPLHVFHVYRKDGTALFLHPFHRVEKLHGLLTRDDVAGHYGNEPRVESLTLFRNELYRLIEQEVKAWVSDTRFIPRFLLSSAVFLATFLFMSIVLRDPIPILDELAGSLAASIVAYILLGKRYMRSDGALKRRIELRAVVDRIVFAESSFVSTVEEILAEREVKDAERSLEYLLGSDAGPSVTGSDGEMEQLLGYLDAILSGSEYRQTRKRLRRARRDRSDRSREGLRRALRSGKIDIALLSLYVQLKEKTGSGA